VFTSLIWADGTLFPIMPSFCTVHKLNTHKLNSSCGLWNSHPVWSHDQIQLVRVRHLLIICNATQPMTEVEQACDTIVILQISG